MNRKKRILVAPLNWGLGHASRCIPIIRELITRNVEVVLGGDGAALESLKQEFPTLETVTIADLDIRYPKKIPFLIHFGLKLPALLKQIEQEHHLLQKLVDSLQLDAIISDNRYGLYSEKIPSVFITHQLSPISPIFHDKIAQFILKKIQKFDECWIPDLGREPNLTGKLSHLETMPPNTKYIGPLSRFLPNNLLEKKYDIAVVLSGPEPKRSELEEKILSQLENLNYNAILIQGKIKPSIERKKISEQMELVSHLPSNELNTVINQSELIICRAGYSSIMDLVKLNKKGLLIPTKGQSEQEYLEDKMKKDGLFYSTKENSLDFKFDVKEANKIDGSLIKPSLENQFYFLERWLIKV